MQDAKAIRLLQLLTKEEWKQFVSYLAHLFPKPSGKMMQLVALLIGYLECSARLPDGPAVMKLLEGDADAPADKQPLNRLLHGLKRYLEDFLVYQEVLNDPTAYQRLLISAYSRRAASPFLVEAAHKLEKSIASLPENTDYHKLMVEINITLYNHPSLIQYSKRPVTIHDAIGAIDHFWINSRLSFSWTAYLEAYTYKRLDAETIAKVLRPVEAFHQTPSLAHNPFSNMYARAIETAVHNDWQIAHFEQIYDYAFSIMDQSPPKERMAMFNMLINYALLTNAKAEGNLLPRIVLLYQQGLASGALYRDSYLTYGDFTNMVVIGCRAGEFDWVQNLLLHESERLNPDFRDAALKLSNARLAFYQGEFRKALRHLQRRGKFLNEPDKLLDKLLHIYCYYELDEYDMLEDALEAFRKFLERTSIGASMLAPSMEFARLLRRLISAHESSDLHKIAAEVSTLPTTSYFDWLREKIAQKLNGERKHF
jgi:hypothetical protein